MSVLSNSKYRNLNIDVIKEQSEEIKELENQIYELKKLKDDLDNKIKAQTETVHLILILA